MNKQLPPDDEPEGRILVALLAVGLFALGFWSAVQFVDVWIAFEKLNRHVPVRTTTS